MKRMTIAACVLVLATLSSLARAEPADQEPADPETAFKLSAIGAAVPAAVAGVSALMVRDSNDALVGVVVVSQLVGVITPSLGEMYSHEILTAGMAMRLGGLVVESLGLFNYINTDVGDCEDHGPDCHHPAKTYALIAGGAALYAGGMLYDVLRARSAASSWNREHDLVVMPTALKTQGSITPGLALALRF